MKIDPALSQKIAKIGDAVVGLVTGLNEALKDVISDNELGFTDLTVANGLFQTVKDFFAALKE